MCNYNMADTLEQSLTSILDQLDDRFEVLLVDDGSSDNSIKVIEDLQTKYKNLRLHPMPRDRKRKLGFTRNVSIQEARGDYVLLHLDCDDTYGPFITDFTAVFHQIEKCLGHDFLLSGQHINMARRNFLLQHGPYRNLKRCQDRDLWIRMAALGAYIPLQHHDFATRLPKQRSERIFRIFYLSWEHILYDFRTGMRIQDFLKYEAKKRNGMPFLLQALRLLYIMPNWLFSKFLPPIKYPESMNTPDKIASYREKAKGTFTEVMNRNNCEPNYDMLTPEAQAIFI